MTQEWWAYWISPADAGQPVFSGWMYLSAFDAQHVQQYLRIGMVATEPVGAPPLAHLINAITGQPAESLVFV
ncbi:hypothetical protein LCGC14_1287850 [marine sediment metagenome]|uniref:Uncharacterized protein n=1 Tax=marine sediment metagenome TaxID=412755 RepID=A0A0F9KTC2_9ZZZZ